MLIRLFIHEDRTRRTALHVRLVSLKMPIDSKIDKQITLPLFCPPQGQYVGLRDVSGYPGKL